MNNLEQLKELRIQYRNYFLNNNYSCDPISGGLIINENPDKCELLRNNLVSFFEKEGFCMQNKTAPSPHGINQQGFTVNIISLVSHEDYNIQVGFSVSFHHKDEQSITRKERDKYYY